MKPASPYNSTNTQKLLRQMTADARKLRNTTGGSVTEPVTGWLAAQYASTAHEELGGADGPRRWEILRAMVRDWTHLRCNEHAAARLQLARETLDLRRANSQARKEKEFRQWMKQPEIREEFEEKPGGLTPEVLAKIEKELKLL